MLGSPLPKLCANLGVNISDNFGWFYQRKIVTRKANFVANSITRSLRYPDIKSYSKSFTVYCCATLAYGSPFWSSQTACDIEVDENIQRNLTKLAFRKCCPGPVEPSYQQRLELFGLQNLDLRRLYNDSI